MQTTETTAPGRSAAVTSGTVRSRAQALAETLSYANGRSETVAGLAHDARNMVNALMLYCDLLEEPGVLSPACRHYAGELRLVTASSRRLVEKLSLLGKREAGGTRPVALSLEVPERPIENLREELLAIHSLLDALAGPRIAVTVAAPQGEHPVWLTTEDLTRVLVNLVKNASEAMQGTGEIRITLCERPAGDGTSSILTLTVEDSGPGIAPEQWEAIFEPGFTTNVSGNAQSGAWPTQHRGLGLFLCRSIVRAAGGAMRANNRGTGGACITMELPVRS